MSKKVLDSTVITAVAREIRSVDLSPMICGAYEITVTEDVEAEALGCDLSSELLKHAEVVKGTDPKYVALSDHLSRRYMLMGAGERSCIAASVMLAANGIENYLVTDDRQARRVIERLHQDTDAETAIGLRMPKIRSTGTVGLISRLRRRGLITDADCTAIKKDLSSGSFRITAEVLSSLCT